MLRLVLLRAGMDLLDPCGQIHAFVENGDDTDRPAGNLAEENVMVLMPGKPDTGKSLVGNLPPAVPVASERVDRFHKPADIGVSLFLSPLFQRVVPDFDQPRLGGREDFSGHAMPGGPWLS